MKYLYLLLCISILLMTTPTLAEPLGSKKREKGMGPRGNTPQMQFYEAAEQDAEDKYATIIDPADKKEELQEPVKKEQAEPAANAPTQQ